MRERPLRGELLDDVVDQLLAKINDEGDGDRKLAMARLACELDDLSADETAEGDDDDAVDEEIDEVDNNAPEGADEEE